MESYVCAACGAVVSCARREAHDLAWCPSRPPREEEDSDEDEEDEEAVRIEGGTGCSSSSTGGARALLSPMCQEEVTVTLGRLPALTLHLEQRGLSGFGPASTGGVLWYADRVMAEYLAFVSSGEDGNSCSPKCLRTSEITEASHRVALVLGCGGVPLSGLVASALGWDVVLTDLGVVLPHVQRNVDRNLDALLAARIAGRQTPNQNIQVLELPFGDDEALARTLEVLCGGARAKPLQRQLLLLCSDCVWQRELHRPLLCTIASAFSLAALGDGAAALVLFQTRHPGVEASFLELAQGHEFGLEVTRVDLEHVLPHVSWPAQVRSAMLSREQALSDHFMLYRLTAQQPEPLPTALATAPPLPPLPPPAVAVLA